jgi:aminomethyltransferase
MPTSLKEAFLRAGATVDPASDLPSDFGDPARELDAALKCCVLCDVSRLGRIRAAGRDVLDLLHRLTTADVWALPAGSGLPAVLTSPKGRIVERLFVHHLGDDGVLLVTGPQNAERVRAHLLRFVFREDVVLSDETEATSQLALCGPASREVATAAGVAVPPRFGSAPSDFAGARAVALGEDGFSGDGVSIVVPVEDAAAAWTALIGAVLAAGGAPAGTQALEAWRVLVAYPRVETS